MKRTSVYLTESEDGLLDRLAERDGTTRAAVLRNALAAYEAAPERPNREFASSGWFEGNGRSMAAIREEELLEGFGEQ